MRTQQCAVFDPDHYNVIDITNYEKYRQHIEEQRQMEIQKAKAKHRRKRQRRKYIAQKIFCIVLMIAGYMLIKYVNDTWFFGLMLILFGLLVITEGKTILW